MSNKYRDAAATATIKPALGPWTARSDTLPTHVAGFFKLPLSEPWIGTVAYIAAADSFTPNVSSLLAALRLADVATTAGSPLFLFPTAGCGIVMRQSFKCTAIDEEYFASLHGFMRSSTFSLSSRPVLFLARSPFDEPLQAFVPLISSSST